MYTVTVNVKTSDGRKDTYRLTFKTKNTCKLFIEKAREVVEVINYSITETNNYEHTHANQTHRGENDHSEILQ